jgi:nicotinate-nucleotide adenylyltransferase
MSIAELSRLLDARLDATLSEKRAAHSRGVAALAAELCRRQGIEPERGRVAGLAHDLCKELPLARQRLLFDAYASARPGFRVWTDGAGGEALSDEILHGPAAAGLLLSDYSLADEAILEAVAFHTVGRVEMGPLAVLVYCADKIEPGRKHVDEAFRQACLAMEPREMLHAVVADCLSWLRSKGRVVAPATLLLYNALLEPEART